MKVEIAFLWQIPSKVWNIFFSYLFAKMQTKIELETVISHISISLETDFDSAYDPRIISGHSEKTDCYMTSWELVYCQLSL